MSDGHPDGVEMSRWHGDQTEPVDATISQVRRLIYPLHGLDPFDPRD
jgi:acetoin utilization protein AcuC